MEIENLGRPNLRQIAIGLALQEIKHKLGLSIKHRRLAARKLAAQMVRDDPRWIAQARASEIAHNGG